MPAAVKQPAYMQNVMRVLNQIDYSMLNEVNRIDRPSTTFVKLGKMVHEFLHFLKSPSTYEYFEEGCDQITWHEACQTIKRNISTCLHDFKSKV